MAGLKEQEKWEEEVYQIEENDPVHGGENGVTNKPLKQLANRTKWLKRKVETRANITTIGVTQLTNDLTSDAEDLALTAKAGKALKALIDAITRNLANYIPNSKKSNAIDSTSSDNVATSWAAKKAYDKAAEAEEIANSKYTAQNASTTQRGLTQHYSGYDSDREDLSASAKGIKILKGFIDSNTRSLANYIPNSKKSSATDSNSADTVATSAAVKNAYDLAAAKQSPQTTLRGYGITDAVQIGGGIDQTRNKIFMGWSTALRLKVQVDSTDLGNVVFDNHLWSALNTRVKKDGDEIKALTIKNGDGSLDIQSTTSNSAAVHMRSKGGKHPQTSILSVVTGNNATELRVFNTTPGSNFETNRRAHVETVNYKGEIWTLAYGLLHDYFLRRTEFENWKNKFQLAIYSGSNSVSRLYRVPLTDNTGFKIYISLVTIEANKSGHRFRLAEEMKGLRVGLAVGSSVGLETYNVAFESDTSVLIYGPVKQDIQIVNLFLIAEYQY